jgi:cob(I)alamin adenosyltransferase
MENNKHYWRYYRTKQKAKKLEEEVEKLRKDVERYKKSYEVAGTLLAAMARFCRNDVVNAERIARYKNALKEFKLLVDTETYSWIAPVCEKAIDELEKRLQTSLTI